MSAPSHAYRVGELYHPGRTTWPEAVDYNYRAGQHELRMFLSHPTAHEIESVRRGPAQFALYVEQPLIVLLYQFEPSIPWSDQPFSIHLVPETERVLPEPTSTSEPHALLTIHLIDAGCGILLVNRVVTLTPAFTAALHLAIREQSAQPFDVADYERRLAALYRRYPGTSDLRRAAQVRQRPSEGNIDD